MGAIATAMKRFAGRGENPQGQAPPARPVLIVGNPNVGKSAIFNWLTGKYVSVSNYPGTTVEVARARSRHLGADVEVIDTPGMYSLLPITDEERVARSLLLESRPQAVVHVIDAKNIRRMLGLTLQLIEARLPVVLALNMSDEARQAGVKIDCQALERLLGVPVVATAATTGQAMRELAERIKSAPPGRTDFAIDYGPVLEQAVGAIESRLDDNEPVSRRTRAVLLLHGDPEQRRRLEQAKGLAAGEEAGAVVWQVTTALRHTPHYHTALAVKQEVEKILSQCASFPPVRSARVRDWLSNLLLNPLTGLPVLAMVLYFGLYKFVGQFGAGTLVDLLEESVFERYVNPWARWAAESFIPWPAVGELFAGEYGIVTLGMRYALAIVLPIVGTFFLAFSILEDSGYLPRLAMLIDRAFKKIGLNGRAVIPMVLGFGCDTMATMVTRTLETRRERIIATMLLALAIPCSAQMGVILGLLAGHPAAMAVWAGVITTVFFAAGLLAARFLPGQRPSFYMELPPLRLPRISNVLVKTYSRMVWYLKEIIPLFILASVLIWVGQMTHLFQAAVGALEPLVHGMGLPRESAMAFLFGFFRRDYGVAGLYDLHKGGMLAGNQLVVAAVTLTLFLPCIAQFLVMKKERGLKLTLLVSAGVAMLAVGTGWALNLVLSVLKVQL